MVHTPVRHARVAAIVAATAVATLVCARAGASVEPTRRLTYEQVVALAKQGPRSRAADEAIESAKGRRTQARGALFPSVEVNSLFGPSPEIRCLDGMECADSLTTDNRNANVDFKNVFVRIEGSVIQPLWTFGKISAVRSAADHAVRAAEHQRDQLANDIEVEAARAYYGLKLARELRWTLEDGREEIIKALDKVNRKLDKGSPEVTLQDRFRLETLSAEVESRLSEARKTEALALAGMRALVGDDAVDVDDDELAAVNFELAGAAHYVNGATTRRPDLRAAREGAKAAADLADLEYARLLPDLVVLGGVRFARAGGVDDPRSGFANDPWNRTSAGASFALRWSLNPVVQTGRARQARADARRADALVQAAQKGATLEARTAHTEANIAHQQLATARKGAKSSRAWVASVLQAEAIGTLSSKDLADAYAAFFTARARLLTSIFEWNIATVRLQRATGE